MNSIALRIVPSLKYVLPLSAFKIKQISSLLNLPRETVRRKKQKLIKEYSDKLIEKALELEGTITGEHGIGLQKKNYLLKEHPDNLPVMKSNSPSQLNILSKPDCVITIPRKTEMLAPIMLT